MTCQAFGCSRAALTSSCGAVYAFCAEDTAAVLHAAFASPEPVSWHERARAHTLPTMVVGGLPDPQRGAAFPRLGAPLATTEAPGG